jgi:perosamine synthetase
VSCFSFYANKTVTTGEGGMAVTDSEELMARMRVMALHGLSRDAWERYSGGANWDYRIVAPGFKYNMTDVAAALGLGQLARAEQMRVRREAITERYRELLGGVEELELPPVEPDRVHSWHLFAVRLRLDRLRCGRDEFVDQLRQRGIGFSVHWRPLHLHPYYEGLGWLPGHCPAASAVWQRLVSLPLFPSMTEEEVDRVVEVVKELCVEYRKPGSR